MYIYICVCLFIYVPSYMCPLCLIVSLWYHLYIYNTYLCACVSIYVAVLCVYLYLCVSVYTCVSVCACVSVWTCGLRTPPVGGIWPGDVFGLAPTVFSTS